MSSARFSPVSLRVPRGFLILAGFAVVSISVGAVQYLRSPDLTFAPQMAELPVVLPDRAPIYVQKYEVTVAEWNACHAAGACALSLKSLDNAADNRTPATGLSYVDVVQYLDWINRETRLDFRLPTRAEWKFMAAEVLPQDPEPIFAAPELAWASTYLTAPQPERALRAQGSFKTTTEGIVDLNGNVWEWTQDCYAGSSNKNIPKDRCAAFYVAGEHITPMSFLVRDPARGGCAVGSPPSHLGLRLVSDIEVRTSKAH